MEQEIYDAFAALSALYQEEMACAGEYRRLAAVLPAWSARFSAMARVCRRDAACVLGIMALQMGQRPGALPPKKEALPLSASLRKCLGQELRCLRGYRNRETDPEFGPVYGALAAGKAEQCRRLLEIAGEVLGWEQMGN